MSDCSNTTCDTQGYCLMQQQLWAQSLIAFGNLVTTSHNQDNAYLENQRLAIAKLLAATPPNGV